VIEEGAWSTPPRRPVRSDRDACKDTFAMTARDIEPTAEDTPLWALSAAEAARRLAGGTVTSLELVEACLARRAAVDPRIHSYIHVAEERARAGAQASADRRAAGRPRSPLDGVPFAVKDNYDVAGMPATGGSRLRLDHVPARDADIVGRLDGAGAVLLGKLATWEYGTGNGGEYFDLPFPTARNPWDPERFTGGSSTGAGAGVAAGTTLFAMGSDTTGSVRLPASGCGLVGLIATPGRLSLDGLLPNCWSMDVPGPLTWTVEDAAMVLDALGDADPTRPSPPSAVRATTRPVAGMRVAVVRGPLGRFPEPDAPIGAAFEAGLEVLSRLGVVLEDVALPLAFSECFDVTRLIGPTESAAIHEAELRERPELMGFALRDKLLAGSLVRAVDYLAALRRRQAIAGTLHRLLAGYDALLTYATLHVAPRLGVEPEMSAFTVETCLTPFNLSANPAMAQCNGFSSAGLPTAWQWVANREDEASMIALAAAYERATPWRRRRPVL
jgi:aspartyl-tRNA(Asn)/glutamyl-tRNA(Gln) amidotransferase subunit A